METDSEERAIFLSEITGRATSAESILWIGEGHPLASSTNWTDLMMVLVAECDSSDISMAALRRVVKEATKSDVDTSKVLFNAESIPSPKIFRDALNELLSQSPNRTLEALRPKDVVRAQRANPQCVETLCLAVGVSYSDVLDWFEVGTSAWSLPKLTLLMNHLTSLIDNRLESNVPQSVPAKAIELFEPDEVGWRSIDELQQKGIPYEVLLAQRYVGGSWLAHKNRTSNYANYAAANLLSAELAARNIEFRRAKTVGGASRQGDLQVLTGIRKKQVGLVVVKTGQPLFAVAFSSARDGGTARANGDGLMQIPVTELPLALLLTGPGWSMRPETDRLARRFAGRIFTERTIDQLVNLIEGAYQ